MNEQSKFLIKQAIYPDGRVLIVDDIDSDLLDARWSFNHRFYARRYLRRSEHENQRRKHVMLHRLVMERVLGRTLKRREEVDHINGNPLDNRRSNLRLATRAQNARNRKQSRNNTSGFKGVSFNKNSNRWQAVIRVNGKLRYLGLFDNSQEAYEAYCKAAIELHGEYARLS